jgi:hypothetical protein
MMMPTPPRRGVDEVRLAGPVRDHGHGLRGRHPRIGNAADLIAWGRCDAVIAGGSEASHDPHGLAGFTNMTACPTTACPAVRRRPRRLRDRRGRCGAPLLEEWGGAEARGATILAEILGGASTADAHHITAPRRAASAPSPAWSWRSPTPASTPATSPHQRPRHLDPAQRRRRGRRHRQAVRHPGPPVTSTKGVTGHALGAAGALEAVAAVLSIQHGSSRRPRHHRGRPRAAPIDLVMGEPRPWEPGPGAVEQLRLRRPQRLPDRRPVTSSGPIWSTAGMGVVVVGNRAQRVVDPERSRREALHHCGEAVA